MSQPAPMTGDVTARLDLLLARYLQANPIGMIRTGWKGQNRRPAPLNDNQNVQRISSLLPTKS